MTEIETFSTFVFAAGDPPPTANDLVDAAVLAEDLGFHSITLAHHLTVPTSWVYGPMADRGIIDPLVLMPAMASATSRIGIGTNSAILPLLPPYVWAKYFASLDVLSKGRVVAGAAMGWFEEDFSVVGVNKRDRGAMFDEQLEVITRLRTEERAPHQLRRAKHCLPARDRACRRSIHQ